MKRFTKDIGNVDSFAGDFLQKHVIKSLFVDSGATYHLYRNVENFQWFHS